MKKRYLLVAMLTLPSTAVLAKQQVGIAIDQDLSLVAQFNGQYNAVIGDKGLAFDYLAIQRALPETDNFSYYVGGGAFYGWDKGYGVRVPVGIDWNFAPGWDAYAQVHPTVDFDDDTDFSVDGAIGIRFSF